MHHSLINRKYKKNYISRDAAISNSGVLTVSLTLCMAASQHFPNSTLHLAFYSLLVKSFSCLMIESPVWNDGGKKMESSYYILFPSHPHRTGGQLSALGAEP